MFHEAIRLIFVWYTNYSNWNRPKVNLNQANCPLDTRNIFQWNSIWNWNLLHSRKYIWKCRLQMTTILTRSRCVKRESMSWPPHAMPPHPPSPSLRAWWDLQLPWWLPSECSKQCCNVTTYWYLQIVFFHVSSLYSIENITCYYYTLVKK